MEGEIRAKAGTQAWVEALSPRDRVDYEQARSEEIDDWSKKTTVTLQEKFGSANLDPEIVDEVSKKIATIIRDGFEQGIQIGMDGTRQQHEAELDHYRSIEINRLGGYG